MQSRNVQQTTDPRHLFVKASSGQDTRFSHLKTKPQVCGTAFLTGKLGSTVSPTRRAPYYSGLKFRHRQIRNIKRPKCILTERANFPVHRSGFYPAKTPLNFRSSLRVQCQATMVCLSATAAHSNHAVWDRKLKTSRTGPQALGRRNAFRRTYQWVRLLVVSRGRAPGFVYHHRSTIHSKR